ncbi:MAG: DUF5723 family protein [Bacteroidia bacterium]
MKNKITFLFLFLLSICLKTQAQFQNGIYSSNFAGVMGPMINPSSTNWLSNSTEVMPIGVSFSVLNNGFYLPAKPLPSLLGTSFSQFMSDTGKNVSEVFDRVFQIKRDLKKSNYAYIDFTMMGPSFLSSFGKNSVGLYTGIRTVSSSHGLSPELATFLLKGNRTNDLFGKTMSMDGSRSGNLAFFDIAVNFSTIIKESLRYAHRFGVNGHFLLGINSVYWADNGSKWTFGNDSTIYVENGNFNFGYAATKSKYVSELMAIRGNGFAGDIGYTLIRKRKGIRSTTAQCPNIAGGGRVRKFQTYKWRFGISVMDIGFINFKKQTVNTSYGNINAGIDSLIDAAYKGVFALDRALRFGFTGNPGTEFSVTDNYQHFLPTRVNIQFDYNWKDMWFLSFNASQRVVINDNLSNRAPNILAVALRHENAKQEWSVPISLIEYQYPLVGFHYRYGPFFIGTNQALEMIGLRKIRGVDLYLGLKFNISHIKGY